jgi:predicted AAA+ superfamily ATPase
VALAVIKQLKMNMGVKFWRTRQGDEVDFILLRKPNSTKRSSITSSVNSNDSSNGKTESENKSVPFFVRMGNNYSTILGFADN